MQETRQILAKLRDSNVEIPHLCHQATDDKSLVHQAIHIRHVASDAARVGLLFLSARDLKWLEVEARGYDVGMHRIFLHRNWDHTMCLLYPGLNVSWQRKMPGMPGHLPIQGLLAKVLKISRLACPVSYTRQKFIAKEHRPARSY